MLNNQRIFRYVPRRGYCVVVTYVDGKSRAFKESNVVSLAKFLMKHMEKGYTILGSEQIRAAVEAVLSPPE